MIGFGEYGGFAKQRNLEITSLSDKRLMLIDPTVDGFYDNVLQFSTGRSEKINLFIEAVREVQEEKLTPFWRPVMDPSEIDGKIVYMEGEPPAAGHSYNWWKAEAEKMPSVEGNIWLLGNECQYYADEVALINQYVAEGHDLYEAIYNVVIKSAEFGYYIDSKRETRGLEVTGSREICGRYDLGNTTKILSCSSERYGGFWKAGGEWDFNSVESPLADLSHRNSVDKDNDDSVGWLVLPCRSVH